MGPQAPGSKADIIVVPCRRYRCIECTAVVLVVPSAMLARRQFSASAIALALLLWGLLREPPERVRAQVSPWAVVGPAAKGWASLARWSDAAAAEALFDGVIVGPSASSRREVARQVASGLLGRAPPGLRNASLQVQVFAAAARAP